MNCTTMQGKPLHCIRTYNYAGQAAALYNGRSLGMVFKSARCGGLICAAASHRFQFQSTMTGSPGGGRGLKQNNLSNGGTSTSSGTSIASRFRSIISHAIRRQSASSGASITLILCIKAFSFFKHMNSSGPPWTTSWRHLCFTNVLFSGQLNLKLMVSAPFAAGDHDPCLTVQCLCMR